MDIAIQSTFRRFLTQTTLLSVCFVLASCSNKKESEWFHFGHKPPPIEVKPEESPPAPTTPDLDPVPAQPIDSPPDLPQTETEPVSQDEPAVELPEPNVEEIVRLYRRLHVEMDQSARSQLIVELLSDSRERVRLLGFDLASRDLSAGATLSDEAANAIVSLLSDPLPSVRNGSAHLITRLALPDAMTLLTEALSSESDPVVAESLLRGVERWPSPQAGEDVLMWYQSSGSVRDAAANAAWGLAELDLWIDESDAAVLQSVYRSIPDADLTDADLRLIAVTGTNSDINRLITLARDPNNPTQLHAANALVFTPRGVEPLIDLASTNPDFSPAAAAGIVNHRLNPEGIHRLAALNWTDDQARIEALVNACAKLDHLQLSDAIRLARTNNSINDELSIRLLNPLIAGLQIVPPRTAPGVILLAELELINQRPDRALEILSLLPETGIDPANKLRAMHTKATSHILLAEFDLAAALTLSPEVWVGALTIFDDQSARPAIARQILDRSIELSSDQQVLIDEIISKHPIAPDESPAQPAELP